MGVFTVFVVKVEILDVRFSVVVVNDFGVGVVLFVGNVSVANVLFLVGNKDILSVLPGVLLTTCCLFVTIGATVFTEDCVAESKSISVYSSKQKSIKK